VNDGRDEWGKQLDRLARWRKGYAFALFERDDAVEPADVVGVGAVPPEEERRAALAALASAAPAAPAAEAIALARLPLAAWQQRAVPAPPH
jgi:hypothetical protein